MTVNTIAIGGLSRITTSNFGEQKLDDIRVYNRVLSPSEIRLLASERGIGLRPERKRRPPRVQVAPTPPPVSNKIGTTKRRNKDRLRDGLVGAWCPSVSGWGGNVLRDLSGQGNHGTLTNMDPATDWVVSGGKQALDFDGVNDIVRVTGSLSVSAATFVAWIYRRGTQNTYSPILFSRGVATGMNFSGSNALGYHWNDSSATYGWFSNLTVPDSVWCMCAISVTPSFAIAYLCQDTGISSATNLGTHGLATLNNIAIGADPEIVTRLTNAQIADARIYNRALSASEIRTLYNGGPGFGLSPERTRRYVQGQTFTAARLRRQSLIGSGVY